MNDKQKPSRTFLHARDWNELWRCYDIHCVDPYCDITEYHAHTDAERVFAR